MKMIPCVPRSLIFFLFYLQIDGEAAYEAISMCMYACVFAAYDGSLYAYVLSLENEGGSIAFCDVLLLTRVTQEVMRTHP